MKRTIELYGRLRDAGFGPSIEIDTAEPATAADVLSTLKNAFGAKAALLDGCALATRQAVLAAQDAAPDEPLAALPPVSGG